MPEQKGLRARLDAASKQSCDVSEPSYDRSMLEPGIVHIGVGGFHRAHQQVFLDRLAEQGVSRDWGVVGVGLRSGKARRELLAQHCMYSVLERSAERDRVRVVGTLLDYLFGGDDPAAVLCRLADPRTKLVTLTVTGDAYEVPERAGGSPAAAGFAQPPTVLAYLVEALRMRRQARVRPFTVLSCDNLPDNGAAARCAVLAYARLVDERLADWIDAEVAFPSSVVDRITPEATDDHRQLLERRYGIRDRAPVVAESYAQWIVEDVFCNARPPLEEAGVELVADVTPYALSKKRLLNGTHSALGYLGRLSGYERIDEALGDPLLREFARTLMDEEVGPLLPRMLTTDQGAYKRTLLERFSNPRVGDRLQRLCARGSTKMPAYLLPSLREAVESGRPHERLTLAVAAWFRYLRGVDFSGRPIDVVDHRRDELQALARRSPSDPRPLLGVRSVFGDLGDDEAFVTRLETAMRLLDERGPAEAVEASLDRLAVAA